MTEIKFGTDGWRGVIADDFTFDNVRRVAGAIASYVLKHEDSQRGVIDRLRHALRIAAISRVLWPTSLPSAGIPVKLANDYSPTPAISYAVKQQGAAGGVMVTSSHNPWNWNGVKFKAKFGGSATPAIMKKIEDELHAGAMPAGRTTEIEEVDLKQAHIDAMCKFADLDLIAKAELQVCDRFDVWFGTRCVGRGSSASAASIMLPSARN